MCVCVCKYNCARASQRLLTCESAYPTTCNPKAISSVKILFLLAFFSSVRQVEKRQSQESNEDENEEDEEEEVESEDDEVERGE